MWGWFINTNFLASKGLIIDPSYINPLGFQQWSMCGISVLDNFVLFELCFCFYVCYYSLYSANKCDIAICILIK